MILNFGMDALGDAVVQKVGWRTGTGLGVCAGTGTGSVTGICFGAIKGKGVTGCDNESVLVHEPELCECAFVPNFSFGGR